MSRRPPSHSCKGTSLDSRIFSAIRTLNPNDLRKKDSFTFQGSTALRNDSRDFSQLSESSLGSQIWSAIQDESSFRSASDLPLQERLLQMAPSITLLEERLECEGLFINRSIELQGCDESSIRLKNTGLLLRNLSLEPIKVQLRGISFDEHELTGPMIQVENNVELELIDCNFTSQGNLGIWVAEAIQLSGPSSISIQGCHFWGCTQAIKADSNAKIRIHNSFFEGIQEHAIDVKNPLTLVLQSSVIVSPRKTGVRVQCGKASLGEHQRNISITECEVKSSGAQGISIRGHSKIPLPLSITISSNYCSKSSKEGLFLRGLNLIDLSVEGNTIRRSHLTNCWIHCCQKVEGTIGVVNNNFKKSRNGYGLFGGDSSLGINHLRASKNRLGGVYIGTSSDFRYISLRDSTICMNFGNGLTVNNLSGGKVTITNTEIYKNKAHGIDATSQEELLGAELKISNCRVTENGRCGIYGVRVPLEVLQTILQLNGESQIDVDKETKKLGRISLKGAKLRKKSCNSACSLM